MICDLLYSVFRRFSQYFSLSHWSLLAEGLRRSRMSGSMSYSHRMDMEGAEEGTVIVAEGTAMEADGTAEATVMGAADMAMELEEATVMAAEVDGMTMMMDTVMEGVTGITEEGMTLQDIIVVMPRLVGMIQVDTMVVGGTTMTGKRKEEIRRRKEVVKSLLVDIKNRFLNIIYKNHIHLKSVLYFITKVSLLSPTSFYNHTFLNKLIYNT